MKLPSLVLVTALLIAPVVAAAPTEEPPTYVLSWGSFGGGDGQMRWPYELATDAQGNVYVADHGNDRIQKFSNNGDFLLYWGGEGIVPGRFSQPEGIAIAPDGRIYVLEYGNQRVQAFDANTGYLTQWQSGFFRPQGIAVGPDGSVYVADTGNHMIKKFTAEGDANDNLYVTVWPNTVAKFSSAGVLLTQWGTYGSGPGLFSCPTGIAMDLSGNVFVAESQNYCGNYSLIQKFSPSTVPTVHRTWGELKARFR